MIEPDRARWIGRSIRGVGRLKSLIDSFCQTTLNQYPGIENLSYDFSKRQFVGRASGKPVSSGEFHAIALTGRGSPAPFGRNGAAKLTRPMRVACFH
jgi:hypothetical protein